MTDRLLARARAALGAESVTSDRVGCLRIAPTSTDALAHALALAAAEGWKVRIEGRGSWCPADTPADVAITTARLDRVVAVSPPDLVATVQAGAALDAVNAQLRAQGVWLAWDPPGPPGRSLGSVVATATAGPLRYGFGPIRDHLLGCAVVTGDGQVIRPGGTVVKNVAGYDLTRLTAGGFGAFGAITELHLRLRAIPEADRTMVTRGPRASLLSAGQDLVAACLEAAAIELATPPPGLGAGWTLALRALGSAEGVAAELDRARHIAPLDWTELAPAEARSFWQETALATARPAVTIRLGVLLADVGAALDLVQEQLGVNCVSASAGSGAIRWAGNPSVEALRALRGLAAARDIPVTLERGPWSIRERFGHFGRYRHGVGQLVHRLRDVFDPSRILQVALDT